MDKDEPIYLFFVRGLDERVSLFVFLHGLKDIFIWSHKMILCCFIEKYGNSGLALYRFLKWEISEDGLRRSALGSKSLCNFR